MVKRIAKKPKTLEDMLKSQRQFQKKSKWQWFKDGVRRTYNAGTNAAHGTIYGIDYIAHNPKKAARNSWEFTKKVSRMAKYSIDYPLEAVTGLTAVVVGAELLWGGSLLARDYVSHAVPYLEIVGGTSLGAYAAWKQANEKYFTNKIKEWHDKSISRIKNAPPVTQDSVIKTLILAYSVGIGINTSINFTEDIRILWDMTRHPAIYRYLEPSVAVDAPEEIKKENGLPVSLKGYVWIATKDKNRRDALSKAIENYENLPTFPSGKTVQEIVHEEYHKRMIPFYLSNQYVKGKLTESDFFAIGLKESGQKFNQFATSKFGAAGIWQLMPDNAHLYLSPCAANGAVFVNNDYYSAMRAVKARDGSKFYFHIKRYGDALKSKLAVSTPEQLVRMHAAYDPRTSACMAIVHIQGLHRRYPNDSKKFIFAKYFEGEKNVDDLRKAAVEFDVDPDSFDQVSFFMGQRHVKDYANIVEAFSFIHEMTPSKMPVHEPKFYLKKNPSIRAPGAPTRFNYQDK